MDKVLDFAHKILKDHINKESICIDATMGNGNDTYFLASLAKKVYAFDIQEVAITKTKEKCLGLNNIVYILDSHENIKKYVSESVDGAIFNLGYLPGGDKTITTNFSSTINAIKATLDVLNKKGTIVIVVYPGCDSGLLESNNLLDFLPKLNQKEYEVLKYEFINQINMPPYLLIIERI